VGSGSESHAEVHRHRSGDRNGRFYSRFVNRRFRHIDSGFSDPEPVLEHIRTEKEPIRLISDSRFDPTRRALRAG
jgi:hypothetical protein